MRYEFVADEPLITVEEGESFQVETEDAGSGLVTSPEMADRIPSLPTKRSTPPKSNPIGGPIAVAGAEPGDLLEVEIESIDLQPTGYTNWGPDRTKIGDDFRWPELNRWTVRVFEHRDGSTFLDGERLWPTRPMVGCIGVAPEREALNTSTGQTISGGNLDSRDIAVGTRVQLNVYHPGALLFLGDVHASQADTEYYGTADETRAVVQARCRVIKGTRIPFIRLLKPDSRRAAGRAGRAALRCAAGRAGRPGGRGPDALAGRRLRRERRTRLPAHLHQPRLPHQRLSVHAGAGASGGTSHRGRRAAGQLPAGVNRGSRSAIIGRRELER